MSRENEALFRIYLMGQEEARRGLPLRKAHNLATPTQRAYRSGYAGGTVIHQSAEVWEPTAEEKQAKFLAYVAGQDAAENEEPCDPSFLETIPEKRRYQEGYWVRNMSLAYAKEVHQPW